MSDSEKWRTIGYLPSGRTKDRVREGRRKDGVRVKATTDELGATTTEHNTKDDRVDVAINPQPIRVSIEELRRGAK